MVVRCVTLLVCCSPAAQLFPMFVSLSPEQWQHHSTTYQCMSLLVWASQQQATVRGPCPSHTQSDRVRRVCCSPSYPVAEGT